MSTSTSAPATDSNEAARARPQTEGECVTYGEVIALHFRRLLEMQFDLPRAGEQRPASLKSRRHRSWMIRHYKTLTLRLARAMCGIALLVYLFRDDLTASAVVKGAPSQGARSDVQGTAPGLATTTRTRSVSSPAEHLLHPAHLLVHFLLSVFTFYMFLPDSFLPLLLMALFYCLGVGLGMQLVLRLLRRSEGTREYEEYVGSNRTLDGSRSSSSSWDPTLLYSHLLEPRKGALHFAALAIVLYLRGRADLLLDGFSLSSLFTNSRGRGPGYCTFFRKGEVPVIFTEDGIWQNETDEEDAGTSKMV